MHPMLNIALRAARKAGDLIIKHYETPSAILANLKGDKDFRTDTKDKAEYLIIEVIKKFYPQHSIITEEDGRITGKESSVGWVINALDGATNFIKRHPHFAISIAACIKGRTEVAVVYDPIRNEWFTGSRGQGAQLNRYRMRGSTVQNLERAILATCFPFQQKHYANKYSSLIKKIFLQCADFRRSGSTALDLAYVAAGRLDGFFEISFKPGQDFLSGELLVREAGGLITDFTGGHNYLLSGNIVAGNPRVVKAILSTVRDELDELLKH